MFDTKHLADGTVIVTDSDTLNTRYVVWQDDGPESPAECGYNSEVMVYRTAYNGRVDAPADELAIVFQRVLDQHNDDTLALLVTQRYARIILGWSPARAKDAIVTYSHADTPKAIGGTFSRLPTKTSTPNHSRRNGNNGRAVTCGASCWRRPLSAIRVGLTGKQLISMAATLTLSAGFTRIMPNLRLTSTWG